jgi:hypothetical protein
MCDTESWPAGLRFSSSTKITHGPADGMDHALLLRNDTVSISRSFIRNQKEKQKCMLESAVENSP